jgi:ferredoxin
MPDTLHTVVLEPAGLSFKADQTTPLLTAARAQGIALASSCRNGTCRTCMCRLVSGTVRYAIEWPGISTDEKKEGWILPCVAQACSDLVIDEPRAALQITK